MLSSPHLIGLPPPNYTAPWETSSLKQNSRVQRSHDPMTSPPAPSPTRQCRQPLHAIAHTVGVVTPYVVTTTSSACRRQPLHASHTSTSYLLSPPAPSGIPRHRHRHQALHAAEISNLRLEARRGDLNGGAGELGPARRRGAGAVLGAPRLAGGTDGGDTDGRGRCVSAGARAPRQRVAGAGEGAALLLRHGGCAVPGDFAPVSRSVASVRGGPAVHVGSLRTRRGDAEEG